MTKNCRLISIFLCIAALDAGTAHAEDDAEPTDRGTGTFVGGILLTSIGTPIGLLLTLIGMDWSGHDCQASERERECNPGNGLFLGGVALTGVSLGVGIPLIVSGARQRRAWRRWRQAHDAESASSYRLDLAPIAHGGKLQLTFVLN